jgi:hypothetical protein
MQHQCNLNAEQLRQDQLMQASMKHQCNLNAEQLRQDQLMEHQSMQASMQIN